MLRLRSVAHCRIPRYISNTTARQVQKEDVPNQPKEEQLLTLGKRPMQFDPENVITETEEIEELYRGVDILLLAHSPNILDSYAEFIRLAATELGVDFGGFTDPLIHQDKWRVNKATFKYGKHKIEYCARSYKKVNKYTQYSLRRLYYIKNRSLFICKYFGLRHHNRKNVLMM